MTSPIAMPGTTPTTNPPASRIRLARRCSQSSPDSVICQAASKIVDGAGTKRASTTFTHTSASHRTSRSKGVPIASRRSCLATERRLPLSAIAPRVAHLGLEQAPDVQLHRAESRLRLQLRDRTGTLEPDRYLLDDATWGGAHDDHPVGERDGLVDGVRDEQHGLAMGLPDAQQ